jgi:Polysaccharide pyruvyl transferase
MSADARRVTLGNLGRIPRIVYYTYKSTVGGLMRNIGDRVIFLGVKNIVREALGPHHIVECDFDGDDDVMENVDAVVFCGTPQIAGLTHPQGIHKSIMRVLEKSRIPVLNVGAGAFHFNNQTHADFVEEIATSRSRQMFSNYGKFSLLTVRDRAAKDVMDRLGVANHLLPCPGFYSTMNARPGEKRLCLISPLGVGSTYWDHFEGSIFSLFSQIAQVDPKAQFIAHDQSDIELLNHLGLDYFRSDREEDFVSLLASCKRLLTFRIHSALPATSFGAQVLLAGFDNRIHMAAETGITVPHLDLLGCDDVVGAYRAMCAAEPIDYDITGTLSSALKVYVRLIRAIPVEDQRGRAGLTANGDVPPQFFYTTEPIFDIPLEMMSFKVEHRLVAGTAELEVLPEVALMFGPYVRLPRGDYRLVVNLNCTATVGCDCLVVCVRLTSGRELCRNRYILGDINGSIVIDETFEHRFEVPKIELQLFAIGGKSTPGGRLVVEGIRIERLSTH